MSDTIRMGNQPSDEEVMAGVGTVSVLDDLKADLAKKVEDEILEAVVPARATIMVRYKCNFEFDELKRWTKSAKESRQKDAPINSKKLALIILANTCVGMMRNMGTEENPNWVEAFGADGKSLTFSHPEIQNALGAALGGVFSAIEKMYTKDGHIMLVSQAITAKAGYADLDFEADSDPLGT